MEMIVQVLGSLFHPLALGVNIFGVVLGIIFGAMPGLNGVVGVALLLPLTYGLSPANGLMMLGGLYMGATYGGSISAILLNCPGTGEAACTALNGNPLARQGRAMEALSYSALSSGIGGMFGTLVMLFFTPVLAKMALKFGPPELFLVCLAGLAVVGSLMDKSMAKGFFAVGVGLVLSMVGMDTMSSNYRFTFGSADLQAGLNLIPVSVGFFAIAEMLDLMSQSGENGEICSELKPFSVREAFAGCLSRWWVILKSSVIGTIIGILPGTGGAIASFIAYGEAKRTSKEGALFGKGSIDGIVAPESANNAAVGGSFVPLMSLGIPGSATSAIIFGALTVHGLIPGPRLFVNNADVVYTMMLGLVLSVVFMVIIGLGGVKFFAKVLKIDKKVIVPAVLAFSLIGAYSARNSMFDVLVAIVFGVAGLVCKRAKIPVAPIILGMILGTMAEENLRRAMTIASAKSLSLVGYIVMRPVSLVVLALVALLIAGNVYSSYKQRKAKN